MHNFNQLFYLCNDYLCQKINFTDTDKCVIMHRPIMLVSHCGEYMANGLTNAVRHEFAMIANDRQTFVAVRKHSRRF